MQVDGKNMRTIWTQPDKPGSVFAIDQRRLPHELTIVEITTAEQMHAAIKDMLVRGAPLIGVAAAFGAYLSALESNASLSSIQSAFDHLSTARPTAVNLAWALEQQRSILKKCPSAEQAAPALMKNAIAIADGEVAIGESIGEHGLKIFEELHKRKDAAQPLNVLTHCNAGWLCTVDWGTATAPIYKAFNAGIPIHVWVDETRPRNQGAALTAWELGQHGVPYTLIADNTGGHLMQQGMVDVVITGTDRVARNGDVTNKIGTYLKALAAVDNDVPFYVAAPSSSIDWQLKSGAEVPIEQRDADEVHFISGVDGSGQICTVRISPADAAAANYGFDVTPNRLITGLITERGTCKPSESGLIRLFPEMAEVAPR
jgi:methylthioribose-1-phosphate isomerase